MTHYFFNTATRSAVTTKRSLGRYTADLLVHVNWSAVKPRKKKNRWVSSNSSLL